MDGEMSADLGTFLFPYRRWQKLATLSVGVISDDENAPDI